MTVALPAPDVPPEVVRRTTERVLEREEFGEATPTLLDELRAWVAEQIGLLLEQLVGTGQASLVGSVVLLIALAVVGLITYRVVRAFRRDPVHATDVDRDVGRAPVDWHGEAARHEEEGRWRAALRCRYRGLVAEVAGRGLVDEVPGRTTGEYLREVRARAPDAAEAFAAVTAAFDAAWYADAPVSEAEVRAVRAEADRVRAALDTPRAHQRQASRRQPVGSR